MAIDYRSSGRLATSPREPVAYRDLTSRVGASDESGQRFSVLGSRERVAPAPCILCHVSESTCNGMILVCLPDPILSNDVPQTSDKAHSVKGLMQRLAAADTEPPAAWPPAPDVAVPMSLRADISSTGRARTAATIVHARTRAEYEGMVVGDGKGSVLTRRVYEAGVLVT